MRIVLHGVIYKSNYFVLTPATRDVSEKITDSFLRGAPSINAAACRGKPLGNNTPTSVVVPPTSTTMILLPEPPSCFIRSMPARYDAPRIEFVAPDEKVLIGKRAASAAVVNVPSFYFLFFILGITEMISIPAQENLTNLG